MVVLVTFCIRTLERSLGSWFHVILLLCGFMTLSAGLTLRALTPLPVPMLSVCRLSTSVTFTHACSSPSFSSPTPVPVSLLSSCSHVTVSCRHFRSFLFLKRWATHVTNHPFRMLFVLCSSNKNLLCTQESIIWDSKETSDTIKSSTRQHCNKT